MRVMFVTASLCYNGRLEQKVTRYMGGPMVSRRKARKKMRLQLRAIVKDRKNRPCADCRVMYPYYVMHLDHLPERGPKFGSISYVVGYWSKRKLLAELEKCEVVCANCHAFRTHMRFKNKGTELF